MGKRNRTYLRWLCFTGSFTLGLFCAINMTLLVRVCAEFGVGSAAYGIMTGLYGIGMLISAVALSELIERWGRKKCLLLALGLGCAGSAGLGFSTGYYSACAGLLVAGFGLCMLECTIISILADRAPEKAGRELNLSQAFFSVGAVVSPIFAGRYVAAGGNWRVMYFSMAVILALLFAGFVREEFGTRNAQSGKAKASPIAFTLLRSPLLLCYMLMIMLYVACECGAMFWLLPYLEQFFAMDVPGELGISVFWFVMTFGRLIGARVDRQRELIVAGWLVAAVGFAGFVLLPNFAWKLAALGVVGFGMGPIWPSLQALGGMQFPAHSGAAFAMMQLASTLGIVVGQPTLGILVEGNPVSLAFWIMGALCALFALFSVAIMAFERRKKTCPYVTQTRSDA